MMRGHLTAAASLDSITHIPIGSDDGCTTAPAPPPPKPGAARQAVAWFPIGSAAKARGGAGNSNVRFTIYLEGREEIRVVIARVAEHNGVGGPI